jgi:hypothetical protein
MARKPWLGHTEQVHFRCTFKGSRLLGMAALAAGVGALVVPTAGATERAHPPPQLALAQICASEASVQTESDDCAAIAEVLRRRSHTLSFTKVALRYSTRVFHRGRQDGRRWLAHLSPSGAQPEGWPEALPWSKWRGRWLELYEHAGRILRGDVQSPCSTPPDHWGGPMDDWRAIKAGWNRVDCGRTVNNFWSVPRRSS